MRTASNSPSPQMPGTAWWETRRAFSAFVLLAALPLLWPDTPPLVDLIGHMGRYKVQLDITESSSLQHFFTFEWALTGNLGVDLLIVPMARLFGLELGTKLIAISIPMLTVAGWLAVAREVHGRVPPTALFALPLAYSFPFQFGFVNFALSMALALLAFALWLRLARRGHFALRAALFVPISLIVWTAHTFGWGTLGLMAVSAEAVRQRRLGGSLAATAARAAGHGLALAPPLLLMLAWRSGQVTGDTGDWFNLPVKANFIMETFRDRWLVLDVAAVTIVLLLILAAMRNARIGFSPGLGPTVVVLALMFLAMPRVVFGSNYADMRLVPYMLALAIVAIELRPAADARFARNLALIGLAFSTIRTAATTVSFVAYDRSFKRELPALAAIPNGARVAAFVGKPCRDDWRSTRFDHLPALAIIRREAFANDQWTMAGAQLLRVRYTAVGGFAGDPSQLVLRPGCFHPTWRVLNDALTLLPRHAFDYVWLIDPPLHDARLTRGLHPVWRNGSSVLFRVGP